MYCKNKVPVSPPGNKDARWVSLLLHKEKHVISHYYCVIQALKLSLVWLTNQIMCLIFKTFIFRHCLLVISGMAVWFKSLQAMLKRNVSKSIFTFTGRYFQFSYHSRRVGLSDCIVYVKCLICQCKKYGLIHQHVLFCLFWINTVIPFWSMQVSTNYIFWVTISKVLIYAHGEYLCRPDRSLLCCFSFCIRVLCKFSEPRHTGVNPTENRWV